MIDMALAIMILFLAIASLINFIREIARSTVKKTLPVKAQAVYVENKSDTMTKTTENPAERK